MTKLDLNDAPTGGGGDLIPAGTTCMVRAEIVPGGVGEGGHLTRSQTSTAIYLLLRLTIVDGPYVGWIVWLRIGIQGKDPAAKKDTYAKNGRRDMRSIVEAARGFRPDDTSAEATATRCIESYADFDGLEFPIEVEVKKGEDKSFNVVRRIITPDQHDYRQLMGEALDDIPF